MQAKIDPITRAVVQHRLSAIVAEMGEAMLRTSYSQILNSSRDFSLAICDTEARLIARKPSFDIERVLGYAAEPELIHRDNLVLR